MKTIRGKFNEAVVFTDQLEEMAEKQIQELCDQEFVRGSRIRIMPDAHAGAGCTIGTTMTISDKVVPNLVGVDIGCGMLVHSLKRPQVDFFLLDRIIRAHVPCGHAVRSTAHGLSRQVPIKELKCLAYVNAERGKLSIGTLGGGNHFIEIDRDDDGNLYLVVHSGSRHLGKQIAEHYQRLAGKNQANKALAYLEGKEFDDYIHDMRIAQQYAAVNRQAIAEVIMAEAGLVSVGQFSTVHNYIDLDTMILRKGAVSARQGERLLIPMNMRDGSIIAVGRGNKDWNYSAPHGAGRLMSRRKAFKTLSMQEFRETMTGIFTTTLTPDTLDEAPAAYKPMEEILQYIHDTVEVVQIIRPVYNFKAAED